MTKFDPSQIRDPLTIDKKFEACDYVCEAITSANFCANLSIKCFLAKGWNMTKILLI